jgi:hypothetical protein
MEGIVGGDYGHVGANNPNYQQISNLPSTADGGSRREQMWQQKMMQRVSSHEGPR